MPRRPQPPGPDGILAGVRLAILADLERANMARWRTGNVRGVIWAEASGRLRGGAPWAELRIHHYRERRDVVAGLVAYRSLADGGKVDLIGERTYAYDADISEVEARLADDLGVWLARLAGGAPG